MKLSLENLDTAPVTEDISDADVLEMIAQSEAVSELTLSIENLLFNGEKLDEVSGNIYGVITMLEKEALTRASFEFLNMDGALSAVVGRQLEFTEAARKDLTTAALEGLKESMNKGWEAIKRWFAALWDWIKQLVRKTVDLFLSNDKILERLEKNVKTGKLYAKPDSRHSGVPVDVFLGAFDEIKKGIEDTEKKPDITQDDVSQISAMINALIAGAKSDISLKMLGWDDANKVHAALGKAREYVKVVKAKGEAIKGIKEEESKAEKAWKDAAGKPEGDAKKELNVKIAAARAAASLRAKTVVLRTRFLKFAISQAIAMGRVYRPGAATKVETEPAKP